MQGIWTAEQRGFIETHFFLYPQIVPADSGRAIDELLEYEFSKKISTGLRVYGAFELWLRGLAMHRPRWLAAGSTAISQSWLGLRQLRGFPQAAGLWGSL